MGKVSVAILGGSSAFMPALSDALADVAVDLPDLEIRLQGLNHSRLNAVARFCNKRAAARGVRHTYVGTTSVREAADACPVVINKMRVGSFEGRAHDESLALRHGLPGDETIGPAGLASAIRSLPAVMAAARDVLKVAPQAWFVNLSNPMDILLTGLKRVAGLKTFGICELPRETLHHALTLTGTQEREIEADYVGVNHQGWFVRICADGQDLLPRIIAGRRAQLASGSGDVEPEVLEEIRALPLPYMRLYYHRERETQRQRDRARSRGEELGILARELHTYYAAGGGAELPAEFSRRQMPWVRDEARLLRALLGGPATELYVSMRNRGTYPYLPDDAIVEKLSRVTARGPHALEVRTLPREQERKLLGRIVGYEGMAAEAARTLEEDLVREALRLHPFDMRPNVVESLAREMVAHRDGIGVHAL